MTWVTALSVLILLLLEAAVPRTADPATSSDKIRHVARNAALWAIGVMFGWLLIAGSPGFATWSESVSPHGLGLRLSLPVQVALAVLVIDLSEYLRHRLFHRLRPLWLVHVVHHSDDQVDVTTGLRFHPVEVIFVFAFRVALLVVFGLPVWAIAVRALFQVPLSALQHAAVRLPAGLEPIAGWLIVTPAMHRVHHSRLRQEMDSNYGELFSFWDRLFGTYVQPALASGGAMGVSALTADSWQTISGMLFTPLRARVVQQF